MMPTVILVEDHPLVRTGLRVVLRRMGIEVAGEAEDGVEAVSKILQSGADIAVVDLALPGKAGIDVIREVKKRRNVRIVILTMSEAEEEVAAALSAGADGYCVKASGSNVFEDAMRTVVAGGVFFDPRIAHVVLRMLQNGGISMAVNPLTPRELEILRLIAKGASNAEIGELLSVSPATVKTHVSEILRKLSASGRAQAIAIASRAGFLA